MSCENAMLRIRDYLHDANGRQVWAHPDWTTETYLRSVWSKIAHRKRYRAMPAKRRDTTHTHRGRRTLLDAFEATEREMVGSAAQPRTYMRISCESMVWRRARQLFGGARPGWCLIPMLTHDELMIVLRDLLNDFRVDRRAAEMYRNGEHLLAECDEDEEAGDD